MLTVIIIDQRPMFRLGIKYCLEKKYEVLEMNDFASLQEAELGTQLQAPNLVFLGIDETPERMQNLRDVKVIYPDSKVIVFGPDSKADVNYLKNGAHSYLSEKSDLLVTWNCIEKVLEGKLYIDPHHMEDFLNEALCGRSFPKNHLNRNRRPLTARQKEIAALLIQGGSTSAIALELGLHCSTISTVKSTIYAKMKVKNIVELGEVISRNGMPETDLGSA